MRRAAFMLAAFAALSLALSPGLAEARAGGGGSMGSRGTRSFSAPPPTATSPFAAPLERSVAQPTVPGPSAPALGGSPSFGRPAFGGGGFMSGLLGGLIGAGIGGMLFGHGLFGGIGGLSGILGLLLQIALVVFVARLLLRRFLGPTMGMPFLAGIGSGNRMPGMIQVGAAGAGPGPTMGSNAASKPAPAILQSDFAAFERSLQAVQAAWSVQDLSAMRGLVTPEMLSYFSEQLAEQASRGVKNTVSDVRLVKGDLSEGWVENGRQFATVAMRCSMIDVTRDTSGRGVDGSESEHVSATEFWTFMRVAGGNWILSAIQQGR